MSLENILVVVAVLLLLSIFASKASGRLGVPALILFLVLGMLAGSEGMAGSISTMRSSRNGSASSRWPSSSSPPDWKPTGSLSGGASARPCRCPP